MGGGGGESSQTRLEISINNVTFKTLKINRNLMSYDKVKKKK